MPDVVYPNENSFAMMRHTYAIFVRTKCKQALDMHSSE